MGESERTEPQPAAPPVPVTPPTLRPFYAKPAGSSWPMVLAMVCAVFGILGVLGGLCGVVGSAISGAMFGAMSGATPGNQDVAAMQQLNARLLPYTVASNGVNTILAVVLAVGGFGLVSRRSWSRRTLLHWSWLKMLAVIAAAILGFMYQQATKQMVQQTASSPGSAGPSPMMFGSLMNIFGAFAALVTLVWGWALPIFALVWLSRGKIRSEVETWS